MTQEQRIAIGGTIIIIMIITALIAFDAGYQTGVHDTDKDPPPLRVSTMIVSLNASMYNQTWYDPAWGPADGIHEPTLRNDSFLFYVVAHWGSEDTYSIHDDLAPHANITVEVVPFKRNTTDMTIECIMIWGCNLTKPGVTSWENTLTMRFIYLYNDESGRMTSTDYVALIFFGYGSYNDIWDQWIPWDMIFSVGPIWSRKIS